MSDAYLDKQNTFTNVTEWHNAGYTGKDILVWDMEGLGDHGKYTRERILDAAPEAKVINRPWNKATRNGVFAQEQVYDDKTKTYLSFNEFVEKYRPKVLTCSMSGGQKAIYDGIRPILTAAQNKYKLLIFNSAGNDGSSGLKGGALPQENAMYIGAVMMFANNPNDIRGCGYSSLGDEFEEVDFSSFTGKQGKSGTSFSTPFVAGQAALLAQRYGDMSQNEVYNYFKMCAKPLMLDHNAIKTDFIGGQYIYDFRTGYGIPILPHLNKRYLTLTIGHNYLTVDGNGMPMDTAPFIKDSRTFVPIAFISLALGAEVAWSPISKKVTIVKGETKLELYIGKRQYYINGSRYDMDTAPFIKDSRTFVPISWIALALGCRVSWVNSERKVQILEV